MPSSPQSSRYRGRFAPSPTGPLHMGSLLAATASCLEARVQGGEWLLRIEDIDQPRAVPGATDTILRQLEALGFTWDGEVRRQHERLAHYQSVLDTLCASGHAFPCICSRREMADSSLARDGSRRYPGTCRNGLPDGRAARAWRLRTQPGEIVFDDAIQGRCSEDVERDTGDFVLLRADGQFAYQLAVVVDDFEQGITHVLRGADLLDSTPRQIFLQRALGYPTPHYAHLPVLTNAQGEKLSKQTLAAAIDCAAPVTSLVQALHLLGQQPAAELADATVTELWAWAHAHWRLERVPRRRSMRVDETAATDCDRSLPC